MLQWESFDNFEQKRQDDIQRQADLLKNRKIELQAVKEEVKKVAYAEALDKATEDFLLKKEDAVKELTHENARQIKNIHDMIEKSVKEQSLHYAKLLAGIMEHFLPKICEDKSYNQVSETLSFLLEGCDKRHLIVAAHNKTLERFTQLISCQTKRIELVEQDDLKEGMIKVSYEGGGAEMDLREYQSKAIETLSEMLGCRLNFLPDNVKENVAIEDNKVDSEDVSEIESAIPIDALRDQENIPDADPIAEEDNGKTDKIKKPLFQDFGEEGDDPSGDIVN